MTIPALAIYWKSRRVRGCRRIWPIALVGRAIILSRAICLHSFISPSCHSSLSWYQAWAEPSRTPVFGHGSKNVQSLYLDWLWSNATLRRRWYPALRWQWQLLFWRFVPMCSNLVPRFSGLRALASPMGLFAGPSASPSTRSLPPSSIILPGQSVVTLKGWFPSERF